jgi:hypothetical protein
LNPDDVTELTSLNQESERSEMPLQRYIDAGRMWAEEGFDAAKKYLEENIARHKRPGSYHGDPG